MWVWVGFKSWKKNGRALIFLYRLKLLLSISVYKLKVSSKMDEKNLSTVKSRCKEILMMKFAQYGSGRRRWGLAIVNTARNERFR